MFSSPFWGWYPFLALAVLFGLISLLASRTRPGLRGALALAGAGVALEYLTTRSPLPLNVALCEYRQVALIQVLSGLCSTCSCGAIGSRR